MAATIILLSLAVLLCGKATGRFIESPHHERVSIQTNHTIKCTVHQLYPPYEYLKFVKDGEFIKPGPRYNILESLVECSIELIITSVRYSDSGEYSCQLLVGNDECVEESAVGVLTVEPEYPHCSTKTGTFTEGETVKLQCESKITNHHQKLIWIDTNGYNLSTNTEMGLNSVDYTFKRGDNGKTFKCLDENLNKECISGPFLVQYKPNITLSRPEYYTGKEMIMICNAGANPPEVSYSWSFSKWIDSRQYTIENQILRLHYLNPEQENIEVFCSARNSIGTAIEKHSITFRLEPATTTHPRTTKRTNEKEQQNTLVVVLSSFIVFLTIIIVILIAVGCIVRLKKLSSSEMQITQQSTSITNAGHSYNTTLSSNEYCQLRAGYGRPAELSHNYEDMDNTVTSFDHAEDSEGYLTPMKPTTGTSPTSKPTKSAGISLASKPTKPRGTLHPSYVNGNVDKIWKAKSTIKLV